jgi:hypothetical protein
MLFRQNTKKKEKEKIIKRNQLIIVYVREGLSSKTFIAIFDLFTS